MRAGPGELVDVVVEDLSLMLSDDFEWAQRWLMEFSDNPRTEVGAQEFADHCIQQYIFFKRALDQVRIDAPSIASDTLPL